VLIAMFGDYRWIILGASVMAFTGLGVYTILLRADKNDD
jgi:hypothetical protein